MMRGRSEMLAAVLDGLPVAQAGQMLATALLMLEGEGALGAQLLARERLNGLIAQKLPRAARGRK
jgi:hypothetical protein